MSKDIVEVIWCKKNLRIHDNEILSSINPDQKIIGLYFFEPKIMQLPDYGNFHLIFILDALLELQQSYIKLWIPLLILPYDAIQWLKKIQEYFLIAKIHSHEETGNWETYMRDKEVIQFCQSKQIVFHEYTNNWVVRRLSSRDNWNHIWNKRMSDILFEPNKKIKKWVTIPAELANISKETKVFYKKKVQNIKNIQKWGETEWRNILSKFLRWNSSKYMYYISKPAESEKYCSRLSPYISYGCVSIKYIYQESQKYILELNEIWTKSAKNQRKSINFFLARIHWQSHFIQKLEDEPEIQFRNLNKDFDTIRQKADNELIEKVFSSNSGIPYIDAIITQLRFTWWTNFRNRAIIVSFLCNTCMQPWQVIAPRLARLFTDYEPGIHYPQFQMQAGTTGINTIRIYNPVLNGETKDPHGSFIRKYVPILSEVPVQFIHEPHLWEGFWEINYPSPIVDIKENNKIAKDILWKIKWNIPKKRKAAIVKKHASRVFKRKKNVSNSQYSLF